MWMCWLPLPGRALGWLGLATVVASCSAYDSGLLERHVEGVGVTGGTPAPAMRTPDAGDRHDAGIVTASPRVLCGDGEVALEEKCDIAIPAGQPGACPTDCPPIDDCVTRMLN